jgi:hypothetical protein
MHLLDIEYLIASNVMKYATNLYTLENDKRKLEAANTQVTGTKQ